MCAAQVVEMVMKLLLQSCPGGVETQWGRPRPLKYCKTPFSLHYIKKARHNIAASLNSIVLI